jgi:hypothetical protein
LPFDWGSKAESALRIFGADRALLLIEGVAIAKVVMLGIAYPFRREVQPDGVLDDDRGKAMAAVLDFCHRVNLSATSRPGHPVILTNLPPMFA